MSTAPVWESVDSTAADLLTLLAEERPAIPSVTDEWDYFLGSLKDLASATGLIDPNRLRDRLRDRVKPCRIGAFTRRALCAGLVAYSGQHVTSDDLTSRNRGKSCRVLRWTGT